MGDATFYPVSLTLTAIVLVVGMVVLSKAKSTSAPWLSPKRSWYLLALLGWMMLMSIVRLADEALDDNTRWFWWAAVVTLGQGLILSVGISLLLLAKQRSKS